MKTYNSILINSIPQVVIASAIEKNICERNQNRSTAKRVERNRKNHDQTSTVKESWFATLLNPFGWVSAKTSAASK